MLDRLDLVPWNQLSHAYGSAEGVPHLLRALTSKDDSKREEALSELFGNIWHQGTVYEATAYAVPFLIEIAVDRSIAGRADVLGLVGVIAESDDGPATSHEEVLKKAWVLTELLSDPEPLVRASAAYVLGFLRAEAATIAPQMRRAIEKETDDGARAGMFLGLASLRDPTDENVEWLEGRLTGAADERELFVASVALAHSAGATTPDAAISVLASACDSIIEESWFEKLCWDVAPETLPRNALVATGTAARTALPTILDAFAATNDAVHASFLLEDALAIVFGPHGLDAAPSPLDMHQRRVLVATANASIVWQHPNLFSSTLEHYALPSTAKSLRDFVDRR